MAPTATSLLAWSSQLARLSSAAAAQVQWVLQDQALGLQAWQVVQAALVAQQLVALQAQVRPSQGVAQQPVDQVAPHSTSYLVAAGNPWLVCPCLSLQEQALRQRDQAAHRPS